MKDNKYTTADIAKIRNCNIRTVQVHARKLYGPHISGSERWYNEQQMIELCKDIGDKPGPKVND